MINNHAFSGRECRIQHSIEVIIRVMFFEYQRVVLCLVIILFALEFQRFWVDVYRFAAWVMLVVVQSVMAKYQ